MNTQAHFSYVRKALVSLFAAALLAACGGGGGSTDGGRTPEPLPNPEPPATTGTVGLLFTDKPSDEFVAIKLNVLEAILIGDDMPQEAGLGDGGQRVEPFPVDAVRLVVMAKGEIRDAE